MFKTIEAVLSPKGLLNFPEKFKIRQSQRVLVTFLEETGTEDITLFSEQALAKDWSRPEEDAAWKHLQKVR